MASPRSLVAEDLASKLRRQRAGVSLQTPGVKNHLAATLRSKGSPISEATEELRLHPLNRHGDRTVFSAPFFAHFSMRRPTRGKKGFEYQLRIPSRAAIEVYGFLVFRSSG